MPLHAEAATPAGDALIRPRIRMDGFREAFLGLRVSPQTVTSVRTNLETDAQFEHLQSRVTADGKTRVIRKPSPTPTPALSPPPITKEAPPAAPITVEEIEAVEAVSPECPTPVGTSRGNARGHALAVAPAAHRVLGARRRTGARRSSRRPRLADRRGQSVARFDHAEIDRSSAFIDCKRVYAVLYIVTLSPVLGGNARGGYW